jgi:hypothetical protein
MRSPNFSNPFRRSGRSNTPAQRQSPSGSSSATGRPTPEAQTRLPHPQEIPSILRQPQSLRPSALGNDPPSGSGILHPDGNDGHVYFDSDAPRLHEDRSIPPLPLYQYQDPDPELPVYSDLPPSYRGDRLHEGERIGLQNRHPLPLGLEYVPLSPIIPSRPGLQDIGDPTSHMAPPLPSMGAVGGDEFRFPTNFLPNYRLGEPREAPPSPVTPDSPRMMSSADLNHLDSLPPLSRPPTPPQ